MYFCTLTQAGIWLSRSDGQMRLKLLIPFYAPKSTNLLIYHTHGIEFVPGLSLSLIQTFPPALHQTTPATKIGNRMSLSLFYISFAGAQGTIPLWGE
jgi:hypothetical protein